MLQRYYTEWELRNMIAAMVKQSGGKGLTRTQICRTLGRTKAPHIIRIIEDMVEKDELLKVNLMRRSQPYFLYFIHEGMLQAKLKLETEVDKGTISGG